MGAHGEKPIKKPGVSTRASKKKRIEQVKAADERAQRRFGVAQFALNWLEANPDESVNQAYVAALEAFKKGKLKWEPPGRNTFYAWMNKARAGAAADIHSFRDKPRSGRPKKEWDDLVLDQADRLIRAGVHREATPLARDLAEFAERRGLLIPSTWMVRSLLESYDLAVLSAAAHGRRSAASDALPHPTIPVDYTHQVWTLDETQAPIWIRAFHPIDRVWVSIRLWIIFIADNAARAILAAYPVEPFKRGRTTYSYDGDDIKAAFLSAALPDLATPGSEHFSGFLPETLRWDRHRTHAPLAAMIADDKLHIPMLPGLKPSSRGSIERLIGTMKDFFDGADGHADLWMPEDQEKGDERRRRSKSAATLNRRRRRITRPVEELPTFGDFVEDLYTRVRHYNTVHVNRMIGVAPEVEYHRLFDDERVRRGVDVLQLLEPTVLTVGKGASNGGTNGLPRISVLDG